MSRLSLQFAGLSRAELAGALGLAIALALLGLGCWKLLRRQKLGWLTAICGAVSAGVVIFASATLPMESAAGRLAWLTLLAGVIVLSVAIFYWTVYAYLGRRRMSALLALRFLAIAALLLILFKPALSVQPNPDKAKLALPILVDRSASMDTIDHRDLPSRYRQAVEALRSQQDAMAGQFRLSYFHFARNVQACQSADELAGLQPSGPDTDRTNIAAAINRAIAGYSTDELAGIVLVSDGQHNTPDKLDAAVAAARTPIYCIGVGQEKESAAGLRNVQLASLAAPLEAIRHNVSTVTANLQATGLANVPITVSLMEGDRQLDTQQVIPDGPSASPSVALKWTPGEPSQAGPDIRRLSVVVQPIPGETAAEDNAADLHVLVEQPAIRVLYIEGTLRPEAKFIHRVLSADPNVRIAFLARTSQNKFTSQGSPDGKALTDLPRTEEEFNAFDVVILGDLDRSFLSNAQMEALRKCVNDGKSLLMLGGRNSFGPGGYADTPIEAALPVQVGPRSQPQETSLFVPRLTAGGAASSVMEGLLPYFDSPSAKATTPMKELLGCVTVAKVKSGASVLAVHPTRNDADGPLPVLVVQQYGSGRSAAFTADTTWNWYMQFQARGGQNPYHLFWGQLIRYLAGVDNSRQGPSSSLVARCERRAFASAQQVRLSAQVRNALGQITRDAAVEVLVKGENLSDPLKFKLAPTKDSNLYEAQFPAPTSGQYTMELSAADKDGKPLGADSLPLTVLGKNIETEKLARDTELLKAIAAQSKGQFAELSALPDVVDQIVQRSRNRVVPPPAAQSYSLYNFPLLFILFVGLLTTEWLLRRGWQLQ